MKGNQTEDSNAICNVHPRAQFTQTATGGQGNFSSSVQNTCLFVCLYQTTGVNSNPRHINKSIDLKVNQTTLFYFATMPPSNTLKSDRKIPISHENGLLWLVVVKCVRCNSGGMGLVGLRWYKKLKRYCTMESKKTSYTRKKNRIMEFLGVG